MLRNVLSYTFELLKIVAISLAIIIPIRYYLIQPFYVKGASMEPNFYDHEYLIIDEISYRFNEPQRGDIIVFKYPENPQDYFIKRIIGLPGEKVQITKDTGDVVIYNDTFPEGAILEETYLDENLKTPSQNEKIMDLDSNEYYVLGDNRVSSKDSRSFGAVDRSFIIGKVLFRGWPFSRMGIFKTPEYQY